MNSTKDHKYWESFFQSLQMTYYGLLAGPLFVFAIVFLRAENGNDKLLRLTSSQSDNLVIAVTILTIVMGIALHLIVKSLYKKAAAETELVDKMVKYRKATLIKYIVLAIYQILAIAAFGSTYHNGMMALFTALLLYSSFFRPELQNVKRDLKMNKSDFESIDYKGSILP